MEEQEQKPMVAETTEVESTKSVAETISAEPMAATTVTQEEQAPIAQETEAAPISESTTSTSVADSEVSQAQTAEPLATEETEETPEDDYSERTIPELLSILELVVKDELNEQTRNRVALIQTLFQSQLETIRKRAQDEWAAIADHGTETFELPLREEEQRFHTLYQSYKERKRKHAEEVEAERKENLRKKREIIKKIEELTTREEVKGETFKEFEALREAWNQIGLVPQADKEDLYQSYSHVVRSFYDYLQINRELRDLDFKKNLEAKLRLCEQAEDLLKIPDVREAFQKLQELHSLWKEIGPEMREKRNEIWERFSLASSEINSRHHKFFEDLKVQNEAVLAQQTQLCEQVEAFLKEEYTTLQAWRSVTDKVKELQKEWKALARLPERIGGKVRERFQTACSQIFEGFRAYDRQMRQVGKDNLQKLQDLCAQADAMKESTDWSATTRAMIDLQKQWQAVGFAPRKRRDELWETFRGAMDHFFTNRDQAQSNRNQEEKDNLAAKEAILQELATYEEHKGDVATAVDWLKDLQSRWFAIGHVPFKQKDDIQHRYRELLNAVYNSLGIDRRSEQVNAFKSRLTEMSQSDLPADQWQRERARMRQQIQQLESECALMENNLSFFRSSSSANPLIQQQEQKIASMKEDIELRKSKLKELDKAMRAKAKEEKEAKETAEPKEA